MVEQDVAATAPEERRGGESSNTQATNTLCKQRTCRPSPPRPPAVARAAASAAPPPRSASAVAKSGRGLNRHAHCRRLLSTNHRTPSVVSTGGTAPQRRWG